MKQAKLQDNVFWLLTQLSLRSRRDLTQMAEKDFGLTWAQMHTLCLLGLDLPTTMHCISDQLACDASNVTGIVDRLETQGYTTRTYDPNDRRIKMIALTPKGKELRQKLLARIASLEPSYMTGLSQEERVMLKLLLQKALQ